MQLQDGRLVARVAQAELRDCPGRALHRGGLIRNVARLWRCKVQQPAKRICITGCWPSHEHLGTHVAPFWRAHPVPSLPRGSLALELGRALQ